MPFYWERHPDGPFVTLIRITGNYLDPENYNLEHLKVLAKLDDDEMLVFKSELRDALGDPAQLPGDELFESVEYANGSDEAFLVWLWHELYGDEPFDASILTRLKALPDPFAERLPARTRHNIRTIAWAGEWDKALQMLLAGLAESNAPVSPAEREELAALLSTIGQPAAAITALSASTSDSLALPRNHRTPTSSTDA